MLWWKAAKKEAAKAMAEENRQDMSADKTVKQLQQIAKLLQNTEPSDAYKNALPAGSSAPRTEEMLRAAIPFLDREYQKNISVMVLVMEASRILSQGTLQARSRQDRPPLVRRKQLLEAIRPYLSETEKQQADGMMRILKMREIWERSENT